MSVRHRPDVLDYKGLTLEVDGLADTVCDACGHEWMTEGQERDNFEILRAAFAAKRDAVRTHEGLLTGEQIEDVLELLHLSKADAAKLFGGGPNAFGKYINGEVLQSFAMDRLLRLTLVFADKALPLLRLGKHAPLSLNWATHFVAPPTGNATSTQIPFLEPKSPLRLTEARSTAAEIAEGEVQWKF